MMENIAMTPLQAAWHERLKLWAEGNKLRAEGDKLWAEAVLEVHGNIKMEWKSRGDVLDCYLEIGEVFKGDEVVPQETRATHGLV